MPLGTGSYAFDATIPHSTQPVPDFFATVEAYRYASSMGALITNSSLETFPCSCSAPPTGTCSLTCPWGAALTYQQAKDQLNLIMSETGTDQLVNVAAAGNWGLNIDDVASYVYLGFPQSIGLPNLLVVAASDIHDHRAIWSTTTSSNYGPTQVSLAAPGDDLAFFSGTSAAAPMVAGALVLLMEAQPELRGEPRRAIELLEDTVTPFPEWAPLTRSGGILNIAAAIGTPPGPAFPFDDRSHDLLPPSGRNLPTNDVDLFDVDGDGDLDMVDFPCDAEGSTAVPQLLTNDGTGHFTLSSTAWPQHAVSHCDADFGDIDGDGDLDVIAGGFNTADPDSSVNQNEVYLNGGGVFQVATTGRLPAETDPTRATALCDVDSDGDLDFFAANFVPNTDLRINRLYINDGTGVFVDETSARLGSIADPDFGAPTKVLCAELTLSTASLCSTGDPACRACADPTVSAQGLFASGAVSDLATCLAIRASVAPEVVVAGSQGTITRLLRNQGAGVFAETTTDLNLPILDGVRQEQDVDGADVDGDGDIDLMFATALGNRNLLMLNDGSAVFSEAPAQPLNTVGDWCRETELGDFDGNGSIDVLLLRGDPNAPQGGSPTIYLNQGGAIFSEWATGLDTSYRITTDGDIGDVNGDGWLDILVGNDGSLNQLFIRTP